MSRLMNDLRAPQLSDAEPGQTLLMWNSIGEKLGHTPSHAEKQLDKTGNYPQETQKVGVMLSVVMLSNACMPVDVVLVESQCAWIVCTRLHVMPNIRKSGHFQLQT